MWKVLIADDEAFVREGLKNLIPWEELGYQWSGDYRNGQELVEAIPVQKPDLVILAAYCLWGISICEAGDRISCSQLCDEKQCIGRASGNIKGDC